MSDHYGSIAIKANPPNAAAPKPEGDAPKPSSPKRKQAQPKNKKVLFFSLLTFFLIAGYFLIGIYVIPRVIQKYLPQFLLTHAGLVLTIDDVQLNPINFQLSLQGITAKISPTPHRPQQVDSLFTIKLLFIDLDLTSLIRNTFACDQLRMDGLQLNLIHYPDTSYNLPVLSKLSESSEQAEIMNFASLPFLFSLNNIAINDGRIQLEDQLAGKTHIIDDIQLAIPTLSNFSFQSQNYIKPHFSATINGSPIQLSGEAVQLTDGQGFQTKLSCSIQSLDLAPYFSYLPKSFPLILRKGRADTTLQVNFAPDKKKGNRLHIDIMLDATDVELDARESLLQVTIPAIKIDAAIYPLGKAFHLKDIIAKRPHLKGSHEQISRALQKLFLPTRRNSGLFDITIDRFLSDQGQISLIEDQGENPGTSHSQWNDIQIRIKDFNAAKASGTINVSGEYKESAGSFSWQGKVKAPGRIRGKLLLNEFPAAALLHDFSPLPHKLVKGTATFSGDLAFHATADGTLVQSLDSSILQLNGLQLVHGKAPWLTADSVRFTSLSMVDNRYNLGDIFLKGAILSINSHDLPPLFSKLFSEAGHPLIQGIDFAGKLQIPKRDSSKKLLTVSQVSFQVNRLDKPASTENFSFSGRLGDTGILKAKGILNLSPFTIESKLAFSQLPTKSFSSFFVKWPLLAHSQAMIHGKGIYRYPSPSFQGDLRISAARIQKRWKAPLLTWESAELNQVSCLFAPFSLQAKSLFITDPQFQWQLGSSSPFEQIRTGLQNLLQDNGDQGTVFPFEIKTVSLQNGSIQLTDNRLSPPWNQTINSLEGTLQPLDTTGDSPSTFSFKGTLAEAPFSLTGSSALFDSKSLSQAQLTLSGLPLLSFSKQLEPSPLMPGDASVDLNLTLSDNGRENGSFSGSSKLHIKNLYAKPAQSDTALALAFLSNTKDTLTIELPVADSSHAIFSGAVTSLETSAIKASYTPLLLDSSFKDIQEQSRVLFQPGSYLLNSEAKHILSRYAKLLKDHPRLHLSVTGMADTDSDRAILLQKKEDQEQQRVDTINRIALAEYKKRQQVAAPLPSDQGITEENIPKKELMGYQPVLPRTLEVEDKVLLSLAEERRLMVYDSLSHSLNISPKRIIQKTESILSKHGSANAVYIGISAPSPKAP
jgi:hypothetical protein